MAYGPTYILLYKIRTLTAFASIFPIYGLLTCLLLYCFLLFALCTVRKNGWWIKGFLLACLLVCLLTLLLHSNTRVCVWHGTRLGHLCTSRPDICWTRTLLGGICFTGLCYGWWTTLKRMAIWVGEITWPAQNVLYAAERMGWDGIRMGCGLAICLLAG